MAAAALFPIANPDHGSSPESQSRATPTAGFPFVRPTVMPNESAAINDEVRMNADVLERALAVAEPGTRDLVLDRSLATWMREDPQAAARFAELQADSFLREVGLRTVAQRWARRDPAAAALWAASLGDQAERDQAIERVAQELAASDGPAALALLERRSRVDPLDVAQVGVVVRWANHDFAATDAWQSLQPRSPTHDEIAERLAILDRAALSDRASGHDPN